MKRIFIFGDSNSWGYLDDGRGKRYPDRWPVHAKHHLSRKFPIELIEDCLPGRTTNLPDPVMGPEFDGAMTLASSIKSHQPLDLALIMLGTNDLKARFSRDADDIACGVASLVHIVKSSGAGVGGWHSQHPPLIAVICPPMLGARSIDKDWPRCTEWQGGFETSKNLPAAMAKICEAEKVFFIDANEGATSSPIDPIHWTAEMHHQFGAFMAGKIAEILSRK